MVVLRVWGTEWWMQTECLVWLNMHLQGREVNNYVVGREVWKSMVVNKLMYGCVWMEQ